MKQSLEEYLAAYFSYQTNEEGIQELLFVEDINYHLNFIKELEKAIDAASNGDVTILKIDVYFWSNVEEALKWLIALRKEYLYQKSLKNNS